MTKRELRENYLKKRSSLSDAEYVQRTRILYDLFFACIDLSFVKTLHIFLPIPKRKEPDTWLIVDRIRREFPQVRLSVPRIEPRTSTLEHFYFEGLHQIAENKWGVPEPLQGLPTPVENIDMVVVPLLICDHHGNRVGYGKGYYDKFLLECRPDCRLIGLSFFDPVEQIDDVQPYDQKLGAVITPTGFFEFDQSG